MAQGRTTSKVTHSSGDKSAQLQEIAACLWAILSEEANRLPARQLPVASTEPASAAARRALQAAAVESEYSARRQREQAFGQGLFGEPAWDMLLYLYAAHLRGEYVATTSLARASAVPPTTALRWMAQIEQAGMIERCTLKRDGRVRVLKLTSRALKLLDRHFGALLAGPFQPRRLDWGDLAPVGLAGSGDDVNKDQSGQQEISGRSTALHSGADASDDSESEFRS